jgi:hypothetical protein
MYSVSFNLKDNVTHGNHVTRDRRAVVVRVVRVIHGHTLDDDDCSSTSSQNNVPMLRQLDLRQQPEFYLDPLLVVLPLVPSTSTQLPSSYYARRVPVPVLLRCSL